MEPLTAVPWKLHPYRLVSLGEIMRRFRAELFVSISAMLGAISSTHEAASELAAVFSRRLGVYVPFSLSDISFDDTTKKRLEELMRGFHEELVDAGLAVSALTVDRIRELCAQPDFTSQKFQPLIIDLAGRMRDELLGKFFLSLNDIEAEHYNNPSKSWEKVIKEFPSTTIDIEEASKCLACGRYTASVFHLMRIMEAGLRVLSIALRDPTIDPKTNPTWEAILKKCDAELQKPRKDRSPEWAANDVFFSGAVANLRAVKEAWRNPTLHVGIPYDEEKASDVWNAVRAFMRHLCTVLHE